MVNRLSSKWKQLWGENRILYRNNPYQDDLKSYLGDGEEIQVCCMKFYEPIIAKYINGSHQLSQFKGEELIYDEKKLRHNLISILAEQLYELCRSTLSYEADSMGMQGINSAFENKLGEQKYREQLYQKYSYLISKMEQITKEYMSFMDRMLTRTFHNLGRIESKLCEQGDLGRLVDIKFLADSNECVLVFERLTMVYKENDGVFDEGFQRILSGLNEAELFQHKFRIRKIYTNENSGWMEYITYQRCFDDKSRREYYIKLGEIICLLHFYQADHISVTDMMACGSNPMFIHTSALFKKDIRINEDKSEGARTKAQRLLESSVETYLSLVDAAEYREEVTEGFKKVYSWILQNKEQFRKSTKQSFFQSVGTKEQENAFYHHLKHANEEELKHQLAIMSKSLYRESAENKKTNLYFLESGNAITNRQEYKATAEEIGMYLCKNAVLGKNECGKMNAVWIGSDPFMMERNHYAVRVSDDSLYNGSAGVALYLLNLWKVTKKSSYLEIGKAAMQSVVDQMRVELSNDQRPIGGFYGLGSYIYVLGKYAQATNQRIWKLELKTAITELASNLSEARQKDFISGSTGLLAVMLQCYAEFEDDCIKEPILSIMMGLFEQIESAYEKKENIMKYSGFAFGVAGCIPYLYQLYLINKDERVYALFKGLLAYERSHFYDYIEKKWLVSDTCSSPNCNILNRKEGDWMYGVPGILLEKILLLELGYEDPTLIEEINLALSMVKENCMGRELSYVHGDLGNLEILSYAAYVLHDEKLGEACIQNYHQLYIDYIKDGWSDSEKEYSKSNGLMNGLSGIGYSLLRMSKMEETDLFLCLR